VQNSGRKIARVMLLELVTDWRLSAQWKWDIERWAEQLQTGLQRVNVGSNDGLLWLGNKQSNSLEAWEFHHQLNIYKRYKNSLYDGDLSLYKISPKMAVMSDILHSIAAHFAYSGSSRSLVASSYLKINLLWNNHLYTIFRQNGNITHQSHTTLLKNFHFV